MYVKKEPVQNDGQHDTPPAQLADLQRVASLDDGHKGHVGG